MIALCSHIPHHPLHWSRFPIHLLGLKFFQFLIHLFMVMHKQLQQYQFKCLPWMGRGNHLPVMALAISEWKFFLQLNEATLVSFCCYWLGGSFQVRHFWLQLFQSDHLWNLVLLYYFSFFVCLFVWLVGCCCVRVCRQDYIFIVFCQTCIENTLNITWQCVLTAQRVNHVLVCIKRSVAKRSTEMILSLYSALMRPHLSAASSSGAPNTRKVLTWWSEFKVGPWGYS